MRQNLVRQQLESRVSQVDYSAQADKYEYVSGQHGGYYRHNFVDHAYLYNLYFPPEAIITALKERIHDLVQSYPVAQVSIAELVGRVIDQPAERIVVGNGAAELIKIVSGHIADKLIVPVPSFNEYANAAPTGQVVEFPLEFPSFQLDGDKFAAEAIRVGADVAVVVTPNNPTSMLIPKAELIRLARKLDSSGIVLVVDESFVDFAEDPDLASLEQEVAAYPNVAIIKSMSKAYGICGLRIGYVVTTHMRFAEALRNGLHIWNVNGFAEEFLRILPHYKQEFTDSCVHVRTDRDGLYEALCGIEGMTVFKPDANFVFCRLPNDVQSGLEITKRMFIEHNLYIKDCVGKTQPDSDRYIRIASRTGPENRRLVEALVDVMDGRDGET